MSIKRIPFLNHIFFSCQCNLHLLKQPLWAQVEPCGFGWYLVERLREPHTPGFTEMLESCVYWLCEHIFIYEHVNTGPDRVQVSNIKTSNPYTGEVWRQMCLFSS